MGSSAGAGAVGAPEKSSIDFYHTTDRQENYAQIDIVTIFTISMIVPNRTSCGNR
jgi:hypothetical protein